MNKAMIVNALFTLAVVAVATRVDAVRKIVFNQAA